MCALRGKVTYVRDNLNIEQTDFYFQFLEIQSNSKRPVLIENGMVSYS